jgi:murein DD-endopeptidase MepM/ murein hydrolase activator NlpD
MDNPPDGEHAPAAEMPAPKAGARADAGAVATGVVKERSSLLPSGFYNPMPGGVFAGYRGDTGLDIAGSPRPVYAIASGTLDYSEPGHTLWTGPSDTANCVRFKLDAPIPWKGRQITHVYYAHLSALDYAQAEGSKERRPIEGGERLGLSGVARGSPHLHIGLLLDGEVEQYSGTFLFENEIRELLGGFKNGKRLPSEPAATPAASSR